MDLDDLLEEKKDHSTPARKSDHSSLINEETQEFHSVLDGDETIFKKSLYLSTMNTTKKEGMPRPSPATLKYSDKNKIENNSEIDWDAILSAERGKELNNAIHNLARYQQ